MQNLYLGPTHKTGGAKHKIKWLLFFEFFYFNDIWHIPNQTLKNNIGWFEQCDISLDMF